MLRCSLTSGQLSESKYILYNKGQSMSFWHESPFKNPYELSGFNAVN